MPENQSQTPHEEQPPELQSNIAPPLTQPQPPGNAPFGVQLLLGLAAFVLLLLGIGVLLGLAGGRPPGYQFWLALPLCMLALGVWILVRRTGCGPGLWTGFLIGLGLVALAFGLCLAAFSGMRF